MPIILGKNQGAAMGNSLKMFTIEGMELFFNLEAGVFNSMRLAFCSLRKMFVQTRPVSTGEISQNMMPENILLNRV